MAQVLKSVLVEYAAENMFELVDGVEAYPQFLPWCRSTHVKERTHDVTLALIEIDYRGVRQSFATRNVKITPEWMHIKLQEGPFRQLVGHWHFKPLGAGACKVEFRLEYEFSSRVLEKVIGPVFGHIASSMVDAFVRRANATLTSSESGLSGPDQ